MCIPITAEHVKMRIAAEKICLWTKEAANYENLPTNESHLSGASYENEKRSGPMEER